MREYIDKKFYNRREGGGEAYGKKYGVPQDFFSTCNRIKMK
jgi:hypothetical protein